MPTAMSCAFEAPHLFMVMSAATSALFFIPHQQHLEQARNVAEPVQAPVGFTPFIFVQHRASKSSHIAWPRAQAIAQPFLAPWAQAQGQRNTKRCIWARVLHVLDPGAIYGQQFCTDGVQDHSNTMRQMLNQQEGLAGQNRALGHRSWTQIHSCTFHWTLEKVQPPSCNSRPRSSSQLPSSAVLAS